MSDIKPYQLNVYTKTIQATEIIENLKNHIYKVPEKLNKTTVVPTEVEASSFIENMLLRFPMHPFYFHLRPDGITEILDGYKRLLALHNFIIQDKNWGKPFALQDMKYYKELNGKFFCDLEKKYQRKIEEFQFTIHYTMPDTSQAVLQDIIERVDYKFWK